MKLNVGSRNQTKIQAVKDAVALYPNLFHEPTVLGVEVNVELFGHPISLKETVEGAIKRAKNAFYCCDYSFGIEGGLMEVPYTRAGFLEVGACAVYDGKKYHIGLSPAYEWPNEVTKMILSGKSDASQAFYKHGYTRREKLGAENGGIIGHLTDGRLTREACTKYSIIMSIIHLERPEYFEQT